MTLLAFQIQPPDLPSDQVSLVEIPALSISSTECRQRVAAGEPIAGLVPEAVARYIERRHLYRNDPT